MAIFHFNLSCPEIEQRLQRIESHLHFIIKQQIQMATKAEFYEGVITWKKVVVDPDPVETITISALAQELRDAFLNISNDITRLTDQLAAGGMTEAEEAEVLEEFRTLAADAKALADRTPEPTEPPIEEPPVE